MCRPVGRQFKMGWHQNLMSFVPFFPEKLGWHHYTFYSISAKNWGGTCHPGHPSNYGPAYNLIFKGTKRKCNPTDSSKLAQAGQIGISLFCSRNSPKIVLKGNFLPPLPIPPISALLLSASDAVTTSWCFKATSQARVCSGISDLSSSLPELIF